MRSSFCFCFALGVIGCGDDSAHGSDVSCEVAPGTADAGLCIVGCGAHQTRSPTSGRCLDVCSLDVEVASRASSEKTLDCGNLTVQADDAARAAAHACLFGAVSSGRPFKLIEFLRGIDSQVAYAYTGPGAGGSITILSYDSGFSQFSTNGGGAIGAQNCSSLQATPNCQPSAVLSCIDCVEATAFSKVCQE